MTVSASQGHGFMYEAFLKRAALAARSGLSGALKQGLALADDDGVVAYTAAFDIPAAQSPHGNNIPISVKTARYTGPKTTLCLADARRVANLNEAPAICLHVGLYRQVGALKRFGSAMEFSITQSAWTWALGGLPLAAIEAFHQGLQKGPTAEVRLWAKAHKKMLKAAYPDCLIQWNAKITDTQRRLQASIKLFQLVQIAGPTGVRLYGESLSGATGGLDLTPTHSNVWRVAEGALPLQIASPPRERKKKAALEGLGVAGADATLMA